MAERKSLEQLAQEDPDEQPEIEQYTLFGTAPKMNGKVGGPQIGSGAVKFTAKREKLPGQFEMGEVVELRGQRIIANSRDPDRDWNAGEHRPERDWNASIIRPES